MPQELIDNQQETPIGALLQSSCFACGPDNPHGLHLLFSTNERGEMIAEWTPDASAEGFQGIVHGGLVGTVLDESMAQVVAATGTDALTAELRVRYRRHVASGRTVRVRGWIDSRNKRMIKTEAELTSLDGTELAHAWAVFLALK